ncbi:hypothetical protein XANCAGTX0491_003413 [Xanthoria calcicola]
MQIPSALILFTALLGTATALNIPRAAAPEPAAAAAPEPAGCNGGSYRDPDRATAEALCKSHCLDSCITFQNQDYWYSVCQCRGIP